MVKQGLKRVEAVVNTASGTTMTPGYASQNESRTPRE